jgi:hypothetical protein
VDSSLAISVLMPVYNGAAHLADALDSILAQTFRDYELLVVDDGSTDATGAILAERARIDPRIRVVRNATNIGVIGALNQGIAQARGGYIARMDADDISLPGRLGRQKAFLDAHSNVGVCGAWVHKIGPLGGATERYPTADADIRCGLLFRNVLAHPAVTIRRSLFDEFGLGYDPAYPHAEDYALWLRAAEQARLANLPEVLLHYRMHEQQIGSRARAEQEQTSARLRREQIERLGIAPSPEELATHEAIGAARIEPSRIFVAGAEAWLCRLRDANRQAGVYDELALARALGERWYVVCRHSTTLGPWAWRAFWRSPLAHGARAGAPRLAKFAVKSLIGSR